MRRAIKAALFDPGASPIFSLPLYDLGAGAVQLAPAIARGSFTPTFTRATTAYTMLASGLLAQVGSGVARSCYSADGLTYLGYLAEGARTNRCLRSQAFDNAAWVSGGGGVAVAADSIAAPDGTTTADTLTASGANGTLIQDLGTVASAAKAGGLWFKRKTGTGNIDLTLDGGSTWTTVAVTASWARFQITQTLADEDFGIRLVTSGDAVYAWQGQVETAAFLSSDIPTTSAAVTRNADVLTYVAAGNVVAARGTVYAEAQCPLTSQGGGSGAISLNDGSGNNRVDIRLNSAASDNSSIVSSGGATQANIAVATFAVNTVTKLATAWATDDARFYSAGTAGTPDTSVTPPASITSVQIAGLDGGANNQLFGTIRNVKIWNRPLSAAQIAAL